MGGERERKRVREINQGQRDRKQLERERGRSTETVRDRRTDRQTDKSDQKDKRCPRTKKVLETAVCERACSAVWSGNKPIPREFNEVLIT